jgi:hypothetical protein
VVLLLTASAAEAARQIWREASLLFGCLSDPRGEGEGIWSGRV